MINSAASMSKQARGSSQCLPMQHAPIQQFGENNVVINHGRFKPSKHWVQNQAAHTLGQIKRPMMDGGKLFDADTAWFSIVVHVACVVHTALLRAGIVCLEKMMVAHVVQRNLEACKLSCR